jgi:hypothetical protein
VGKSVSNSAIWDTRRPPGYTVVLPGMRALPGGLFNSPSTRAICMDTSFNEPQNKESSIAGASSNGSKEGPELGELQCSEALQGATEQDPGSVSLECLAERVSTLGLHR